jgi:hypothetical protein
VTAEAPYFQAAQPATEAENRFIALWQSSWEAIRADTGAPNLVGTAEYMAVHIANETLGWRPADMENFVVDVVDAALEPGIFQRSLRPEAPETVTRLANLGPLLVWTAGDVHGGKGADDAFFPGSAEQLARVEASALLAQDNLYPMGIAAAENKLELELMSTYLDWLVVNGAEQFLAMDDKLINLKGFSELAKRLYPDMPVHLVWVRQGMHGDTSEEAPEGVRSMTSLADLNELFASLPLEEGRLGTLIDMDGTLTDDEIRKRQQPSAVYRALGRVGWLAGTKYEETA